MRDSKGKFVKGVTPNPNGRPRESEEVKVVKSMNKAEFSKALNEIIDLNLIELQTLIKNPKTKVLTAMMASVAAKGIVEGDEKRMDAILNRLIGRVPNKIEGPDGESVSFVGLVMLAQQRRLQERNVSEEEEASDQGTVGDQGGTVD